MDDAGERRALVLLDPVLLRKTAVPSGWPVRRASVLPDNGCVTLLAEGMARPISVLEVTPEEKRELARVAAPTRA